MASAVSKLPPAGSGAESRPLKGLLALETSSLSINHLFVKASKMTATKVSVQDQQGSESAYSDPKTKPKYVEKYTKYEQGEVT